MSALISEGLSQSKLQELTGSEDLDNVCSLTVLVDTTDCSLGRFGALLPRLEQLDLSNSILTSIRDLGTGFRCLVELHVDNCRLSDLDGISTLSTLQQLHAPHNGVSEITPLAQLDQLHVLDLSFNKIMEASQFDFLAVCVQLRMVRFEGNPFHEQCRDGDQLRVGSGAYCTTIKAAIPHLETLDGYPISVYSKKISPAASSVHAHIADTADTMQTCHVSGSLSGRTMRPQTAGAASSIGRRRTLDMDHTALRRSSYTEDSDSTFDPVMCLDSPHTTPLSSDSDSASKLHGSGIRTDSSTALFQGSPLRALRARRRTSRDADCDGIASATGEATKDDQPLRFVDGGDNSEDASAHQLQGVTGAATSPRRLRACCSEVAATSGVRGRSVGKMRAHDSGGISTGDAPAFMGTDPELDALMASVGIAPVDVADDADDNDDDVFAEGTSIDAVFEDLRQWRSAFDSRTQAMHAVPLDSSLSPTSDKRAATADKSADTADKSADNIAVTPRPPPGPRPRPPPGPPRSNSGNGREFPRRRSFTRRPRTTSAGGRSSLDFESPVRTPHTRPHPPPPRQVGS